MIYSIFLENHMELIALIKTDGDYATRYKQIAKSKQARFSCFFPLCEILQLSETNKIKKTDDLKSMLYKRMYYTSKCENQKY